MKFISKGMRRLNSDSSICNRDIKNFNIWKIKKNNRISKTN